MSWWTTAPQLLACIALMTVPGAVLAFALGFRRITALGLAPALSVGIAAVAAVLAPLLGLPWNAGLLAGFTVLVAGGALLLRRLPILGSRRDENALQRDTWAVCLAALTGVMIGGVVVARKSVALIGNPENIAQRFDNVFHLNAVRFIMETGNASTFNLGAVTGSTGRGAIYPAVWHSFAALVAKTTGTGVAEAVNVVNLTIAAVVWPVSMVLLARVVAGARPVAILATGILSAGFIAFPFLMMVWGPLFPYMLSVALLPAALGVVVLLVGMGRDTGDASRPMLVLALGVTVAGIALSHMSSVNTVLVLTLPLIIWAAARHVTALVRGRARPRAYLWIVASAVVYIAGFVLLWLKLRPLPYDVWGPHQTPAGAIGEALANSPMGFPEIPVLVSVLGIVGLVTVVRSGRDAWIGIVFVLVSYLYVADAAFDRGPWRSTLTGNWYADANRLAALLPLVSALLGGLAVGALWAVLRRQAARVVRRASAPVPPAIARVLGIVGVALVALILATGVQSAAQERYLTESEQIYLRDWPESVLSSDEYALLERVDQEVPADAVIAVNPWNGGSLAYALTGRAVTVYHLFGSEDPDVKKVSKTLDRAPQSTAACDAIRRSRVSFVLDFGDQFLASNPAAATYDGLEDLEESDAVELVDEQGAAKLYRVVVCQ